jgi:hypothetical protein
MRFEDGLSATVDWYRDNQEWWRSIKSGEWDAYYRRQYGDRLAGSREATAEADEAAEVAGLAVAPEAAAKAQP